MNLIKVFFASCVFFLAITGLSIYIIDPFQHYRKSSWYQAVYTNELYLNPGIAKNYTYDSIVLGTSMTENFVLSDIKEQLSFKEPVKLCLAGGQIKTINTTAKIAFKSGQVKNVLYGLDFLQFKGKINSMRSEMSSFPSYLYDDDLLNDYTYLFNIDMIMECARPFIYKYTKDPLNPTVNMNKMYSNQYYWGGKPSSQHAILDYYNRVLPDKPDLNEYSYESFIKNFDDNFLPLVQENPETNFYVFFPPYSILQFIDMQNDRWLNNALRFKLHIFTQLSKYKNVKMYDLQVASHITHDLLKYKDVSHYLEEVNLWILKQIKYDNYRLQSLNDVVRNNKQINDEIKAYDIPEEPSR